jgi:hypothetical protein
MIPLNCILPYFKLVQNMYLVFLYLPVPIKKREDSNIQN